MGSNKKNQGAKRRAEKRERNRSKRKAVPKGPPPPAPTPAIPTSFNVNYLTPQALQVLGPLVAAQWSVPTALSQILVAAGRPVPPAVSGQMLVDTGAGRTCIAEDAAVELGLKPIGKAKSFGAHGHGETNKYVIHFRFSIVDAQGNRVDIDQERIVASVPQLNEAYGAFQAKAVTGEPVRLIGLLGRDFLRHTKFTYDGTRGAFSMSISLDGFKTGA